MAVTVSVKREFEVIGTDSSGDQCIFPRDTSNPLFADALSFSTKIVDDSLPERYLAFPFVVKLNNALVGIFSDSDSHAVGSSQWMIRSDDGGLTWSKVLFFDASNPGSYNTSLLQSILPSGDSITLKVWTISNVLGVLSVTSQSTAVFGLGTYALWSRPIIGAGGVLWRTGYGSVAGVPQVALFQSVDEGITWSGVSVMFSDAARIFTEADIVNLNGSNWIAIARDDSSSPFNNIYYSISSDNGSTWGAAVLLDSGRMGGRQPNLIKTTDGSIILSTGDRFGVSGYSADGTLSSAIHDTSGITVYRTPMASLGTNPMTTSGGPGTTTILVAHSAHNFETGDVVFIFGAVGFDGIPSGELNGLKTITRINNNSYTIATTTGATAGGVVGGGAVVRVYGISRWGFRTRIAGIYSTDGGQPYTVETSANVCRSVFYQRRSVDQNPIIASALFSVTNL